MDGAGDRPTVEELLAHHEFVRSIARRLSLDDSGAYDLVQRTWLTALERPPRDAGSLRTRLARVVRNLALSSRMPGK